MNPVLVRYADRSRKPEAWGVGEGRGMKDAVAVRGNCSTSCDDYFIMSYLYIMWRVGKPLTL